MLAFREGFACVFIVVGLEGRLKFHGPGDL